MIRSISADKREWSFNVVLLFSFYGKFFSIFKVICNSCHYKYVSERFWSQLCLFSFEDTKWGLESNKTTKKAYDWNNKQWLFLYQSEQLV